MPDKKKYYWLKLKRDFFKRHDTRIIESMENGEKYLLFYLKLLVESIDHEGQLRFSDTIPYNDKMLATITNTDIDTVRSAVKVFTELNMLELFDDGTLFMNQVQTMIGDETEWAKKKRDYKNRKALIDIDQQQLPAKYPYNLGECIVHSSEQIALPSGILHYVDEKRYGGNGKIALAQSGGKCKLCGDSEKLVIHHSNGYSNAVEDLEILCTKCHGEKHKEGLFPPPVRIESDKSIEKEKEKEKEKDIYNRFVIPTIQQIKEYCTERNNKIDPDYFFNYYQSKGWMIGKNKMKDWKSAVHTWEKRENDFATHEDKAEKKLRERQEMVKEIIRKAQEKQNEK